MNKNNKTKYITYCNPVRDCSSVETTTASHPLHPVGMQAIADYVASLQDAASWEGHLFLPNYHPYGMNIAVDNGQWTILYIKKYKK